MSVPVVLSVAEDEGTVMVCAVLTTLSSTIIDIPVTLSTQNATGMYVGLCIIDPMQDLLMHALSRSSLPQPVTCMYGIGCQKMLHYSHEVS